MSESDDRVSAGGEAWKLNASSEVSQGGQEDWERDTGISHA